MRIRLKHVLFIITAIEVEEEKEEEIEKWAKREEKKKETVNARKKT